MSLPLVVSLTRCLSLSLPHSFYPTTALSRSPPFTRWLSLTVCLFLALTRCLSLTLVIILSHSLTRSLSHCLVDFPPPFFTRFFLLSLLVLTRSCFSLSTRCRDCRSVTRYLSQSVSLSHFLSFSPSCNGSSCDGSPSSSLLSLLLLSLSLTRVVVCPTCRLSHSRSLPLLLAIRLTRCFSPTLSLSFEFSLSFILALPRRLSLSSHSLPQQSPIASVLSRPTLPLTNLLSLSPPPTRSPPNAVALSPRSSFSLVVSLTLAVSLTLCLSHSPSHSSLLSLSLSLVLSHSPTLLFPPSRDGMALSLPLLFLHFTYCMSFTRCPSHSLSVSVTLAVSRWPASLVHSPPRPFICISLSSRSRLLSQFLTRLPQPLPYSFSLSESHIT